jgi:hypothetical protein
MHCCLQDVDREQLSSTVLKLISSVASTAPTDDKSRDAVWHPTVTFTVSQDQYQDPLGFGTIDLLNMKLVRATTCCVLRCAIVVHVVLRAGWQMVHKSAGFAQLASST